ncbi:phosphorylase family protein [Sphaerisporangium aureirubrum]|uniref:Nucleoside phosphorylase domain-containing protein n=1 Tax=Sphaerisporangium aureirubrum TaxID=1544736 RepID=A0ABW1NPN2_9ACTN
MSAPPEIGVLTALTVENTAVSHVLGSSRLAPAARDPNHYAAAALPCGTVVTTTLVRTGNAPAADACAHMVRSFPSIRAIVMCGIALGVPSPGDPERDVRLGDIVVATEGIIHYSHKRVTDQGTTLRGDPLPASPWLLRAVGEIRTAQLLGEHPWRSYLETPPSETFHRPTGHPAETRVHYGRIGSGDELLRSATRRDEITAASHLLAIEMEGAGASLSAALGGRECLVIRGISDHGDATKSDQWHPYASLAAAAYLRTLLDSFPPTRSAPPPPMDLVHLMERIPSLQTPNDRDLVLQLLGPPISIRTRRDPRTRIALHYLAIICADSPTGFTDLLTTLWELEGATSRAVNDLATALGIPLPDQS